MGPWHHGQMIWDGSALGAIKFDSDTSKTFRQRILRPFLAQHLKDGAPKADIPPVAAFETGTNTWQPLAAWPGAPKRRRRCISPRAGSSASPRPTSGDAAYTEYVSDPARPVPYIPAPGLAIDYDKGENWKKWLVSDQREASGRTDVAVFVIGCPEGAGQDRREPVANLVASTSGTDSDWVVKLIDVYPPRSPGIPGWAATSSWSRRTSSGAAIARVSRMPKAITAAAPLLYKFALPTANHVFQPGHRIMVQVQSSWFPLYDRNPQTFVPSIFWAKPEDYRKATQRVHAGSFIELPVAASGRPE